MVERERKTDMKLKAYINGKEYENVVVGVSFADEYNETLDSGSLIIDFAESKDKIEPYDDVFIYSDDEEFKGFWQHNDLIVKRPVSVNFEQRKVMFDGNNIHEYYSDMNSCYIRLKYIYVDATDKYNYVTDDNVTLNWDGEEEQFYFDIPNVNATIYFYSDGTMYIGNYNDYFYSCYIDEFMFLMPKPYETMPKLYKHLLVDTITFDRLNPTQNVWKFKMQLFSETKGLEVIPLPNISITQPLDATKKKSITEYLEMYLEMYNPQVKYAVSETQWIYRPKYVLSDEVKEIFADTYCPDLSLNNPSLRELLNQLFLVKDRIPYVKDNVIYAMDLTKRGEAFNEKGITSVFSSMSSENYAHKLKRTYTNALSEENTAIRTEFLGFRNSDTALMTLSNMRLETKFPIYKIRKVNLCYYKLGHVYTGSQAFPTLVRDLVFLCKQDITKLVKLEQERNILSQDWNNFMQDEPSGEDCVDQMAQYKLCTVGYSIGSNVISGWGTTYKYPQGWWDVTVSYIENIFRILDRNIPYGVSGFDFVANALDEGERLVFAYDSIQNIPAPFVSSSSSDAKKLKLFFFEVEYECFYNGTVITDKDNGYKDIAINDNSSNSLTLIEKDGLFQKEKVNRFANEGYTIQAIYDDIDDLQPLGSVYGDDIIIYHREYQVYSNYVKAIYYGTKDYVLKNYFTTVFAKHRPYALMDYGQSTIRAENKKMYLELAKDKLYYDYSSKIEFNNFSNHIGEILSFYKNSDEESVINTAFVKHNDNKYYTDCITFVSGISLCFNMQMYDNLTMGNYIKVFAPDMSGSITQVDDDYTGSIQDFYSIIDDNDTGFSEYLGFYVCHTPKITSLDEVFKSDDGDFDINAIYDKKFELPYMESNEITNVIGNTYKINKDNKEVIDMTYQIEAFTNDKDVIISDWMLKLSNLNGKYDKANLTYYIPKVEQWDGAGQVLISQFHKFDIDDFYSQIPLILFKVDRGLVGLIATGDLIKKKLRWLFPSISYGSGLERKLLNFEIVLVEVDELTTEHFVIQCEIIETYESPNRVTTVNKYQKTLEFKRRDELGYNDFTSDTSNYYYSNIKTVGDTSIQDFELENEVDLPNIYCTYKQGDDYADGWTVIQPSWYQGFNYSDTFINEPHIKNLFLKLSTETIDSSIAYEEYSTMTGLMNAQVRNIVSIEDFLPQDATRDAYANAIKINLSIVSELTKSLQVWFLYEGKYHFVFGVNLTAEDFARGYARIYVSPLYNKDNRVFGQNNLIVGENANFIEDEDLDDYGKDTYYVVK